MTRWGLILCLLFTASPVAAQPPSVVERAIADAKAITAKEELIRELGGMGAIDQATRVKFLGLRKTATPQEREALDGVWAAHYKDIDQRNTERLKVLLEGRGWFTADEVGPRASEAAFHVVNHSSDLEFQKLVLAKMEPLVAEGRAPDGYALLYDRVAVREGRPQRYATQKSLCIDGRQAMPANVENPADLDRRRAQLDLEPMAAYLANLNKMYGRCDGEGR